MKRAYRLSQEARIDLLAVWNYLAERATPQVADQVIADIYAGMDKLSKSPGIGHLREDLTDLPIKFYRVHRYLILYTTMEKPLGIVRVLHGSRDVPSILRGAED